MKRIHYLATAADDGRLLRDVITSRMDVSKRLMKRCKAHPRAFSSTASGAQCATLCAPAMIFRWRWRRRWRRATSFMKQIP